MTGAPPPLEVGVLAAAELEARSALFLALEEAFPVRFAGRRGGELGDLAAIVEIGGDRHAAEAAEAGLPALALLGPEPDAGETVPQLLASVADLDRRLRGAVLPDRHLGAAGAVESPQRSTVLAESKAGPTWIRAGRLERALLAPSELGPEEALRERLCDGRSAGLLPLVHFLRELTASIRWQPPAACASLLFDDPNLHWRSYGFIGLAELSEHARTHDYHVALATVPLDTRYTNRSALRTVSGSEGRISLLVHGNDHNGAELGRPRTEGEGTAMAAQALRRVAAFERRTGMSVDRLMVPPHEECSEAAVDGMLRCGFEAITMTRPFPWLARPPRTWLSRPEGAGPLVGWHPADFAGRLPVLSRHPLLTRDAPELVLRAFLDQPLILYGHHDDVAAGLDVLSAAVEDVDRLRPTRWCSLAAIAAGNFESRLRGSELGIRPYTRRARVELPPGAEQLRVELPTAHPGPAGELLTIDEQPVPIGEPVELAAGRSVELRLHAVDGIDPNAVPSPRPQPRALARRALGEGRDRLLPLLQRSR